MRIHAHEIGEGQDRGPRGSRADPRLVYRAAAAGRVDVLGPAGLLGMQRVVGNAWVQRSITDPVDQARAAISTRSIEDLKVCNRRCRRMIAESPLHPPENARAALAEVRHFVMDQVADLYDQYIALKRQVGIGENSGATGGADHTGQIEEADTWFDTLVEPALGVLMEGDPQYRYEHFKQDVQQKVFAVIRLRASRRALAQIGNRAVAEKEARSVGKLPTGAWCGAFAFTQQNQAAGMDSQWASLMQGEGGIRSALAYLGGEANPWVWAFDRWERLKSYHAGRGSLRWYEAIHKAPPARGIEPGDIVLIDNARGTDPDHVTTAVAFDGRFLRTMGGNQGTAAATDESGVSRNRPFDITANPEPNDVRKRDKAGKPIPDTTDPDLAKNKRIHGVGRWSVVDYEQHIYRQQQDQPKKPPAAAELAAVS